ncbi:hypothetical protein [Thermus albus]|uniref:hypothetical protein n=1 Tax=Thermus albus TaxID=2908146 RepID=UPI001FAA9248|nr:hypothetical protein [Thermus albus]
MPAYIRDPNGAQVYWTFSELGEALSVTVDAALQRAAYSDTWTPGGTGLPMPMEISIVVPITASTAQQVASQLYAVSQQGIAAVGYESPLGASGTLEWERPVLTVRALEVREGGARYAFVRMRFVVGEQVIRISRWSTGADEIVDGTGASIVFMEEV